MKKEYDFSDATRGPVAKPKGKTRITIMIDDAVLDAARIKADEKGMGYQTLINNILKSNLVDDSEAPASKADYRALDARIAELERLIPKASLSNPVNVRRPFLYDQEHLIYGTPLNPGTVIIKGLDRIPESSHEAVLYYPVGSMFRESASDEHVSHRPRKSEK